MRRDLSLFAPEIDPRLLVKMKAEGLTLDDVMSVTSGNLPPYRFLYLIEKAKAFASTLQSFGGELLSALEKKDGEALSKLRVVHEQHLAKMSTQLRRWEIDAADEALVTAQKQKDAAEFRRDHNQALIEQDLTAWERTEQIMRHTATGLHLASSTVAFFAGVMKTIPQGGSPFAMTYGGVQLGGSAGHAAAGMALVAGATEGIAASAGLEATFGRRREDWKFQRELAERDVQQLDHQVKAATIRKEFAEKALEVHEKTIEQTEEVYAFYGDKFTSFGLYTWMAANLQRTYRQAYANALALARLSETAFKFERDDDSAGLGAGYWDASRAGLLAGEQLLLDLQTLERRFIETNYRTPEIEQSFPLTQLDPRALVELQENGSCTFEISEVFFDLAYPGHYRRRIKAVRLTMPCVTGPYTNVGATLELVSSQVRAQPDSTKELSDVPRQRTVSIATSKAQNDAGVFELSFHDERNMPFEGAGAVSTWKLTLPKSFRQFDYQTISDVVVTLNYTALAGGDDFRDKIEGKNSALQSTILDQLTNKPLGRLFSLRQEFPMAYKGLLTSPPGTLVSFEVLDWHFPAFVNAKGKTMTVATAKLVLKTAAGVDLSSVQFAVDGEPAAGFTDDVGGLPTTALTVFKNAVRGKHTLAVKAANSLAPSAPQVGDISAIDGQKLLDVLIYLEYSLV